MKKCIRWPLSCQVLVDQKPCLTGILYYLTEFSRYFCTFVKGNNIRHTFQPFLCFTDRMGSLQRKGRVTKESIIYQLKTLLDVVRHLMLPFTPAISMFSRSLLINFIVCCCFQPWPRVHSVVKLNISTFKVAAKNCSGLISYLKFIQHIIQCRIEKCFTKSFSFSLQQNVHVTVSSVPR